MRHFYTQGVCASSISYEIKDGCLFDVKFEDGCPGNLQALGALVEGMKVEEVVRRLRGIRCGDKVTSCADQLAEALLEKVNL